MVAAVAATPLSARNGASKFGVFGLMNTFLAKSYLKRGALNSDHLISVLIQREAGGEKDV